MSRVLYFSRAYSPHDHRFLQAMSENGDSVWVMHLENRARPLEDRPLPRGVERVHWLADHLPFNSARLPAFIYSLRKVLKRVNPEVVLAGPLQTCSFLVAASGFRRLVSMSWGYDLLIDAKRNRWMTWLTRFTLKRSAALLGDCETIRQLAISYGMNPERIVTFPWGVDLYHFSPGHRIPGKEEGFIFLSTRSWEPIYGVDLIAKAFGEIGRRFPYTHLILLGNGSQASALQRILSQADVLERVSMPGQIEFHELPRYYHLADVYVSASHSDGTSISMLEAMACGRPVIVSDLPGNREWITPSEVGWLFPDGDWQALAQMMEQVVLNRHELERMGKAARRLVEERADWQRNFPKLYQALEWALTLS
ncbi:MAG: glycosyltransferase [Anaerolineales bacterium]|nr:glycosyltransferase [Anaerolineales bacterium]